MNTNAPDNPDDRLETYLDGALSESERLAFEAQSRPDTSVQQQAEMQRRIDASLRRLYESPDTEALLAAARAGRRDSVPWWRGRVMRVAAMVAISAVAVLAVTWAIRPDRGADSPTVFRVLGLETAYRQLVDDGYRPDWVCETDRQFAETYGYRLGQPLVLGALPAGVEAVGLSYSPAISADTLALLARVQGQPVVVFADHVHTVQNRSPDPPGAGLHFFSRRVGDVVLYEVSPYDRPHLLEAYRLYEPAGGG